MGIEYDLGQAFAENAVCKVPAATVAQLEELVNTGSMIKWGRIVSEISDKNLAVLSTGLTKRGRHFLLARLTDERLPKVAEMTSLLESNKKDDVEAVARMIIEKWEMKRNGS